MSEDVAKGIEDMNKAFDGAIEAINNEEPKGEEPEEPKGEEPKEEPEEPEEEPKEEPKGEESEEPKGEEPPPPEPKKDEKAELDSSTFAELRGTIVELRAEIEALKSSKPEPVKEEPAKDDLDDFDFVGDLDMDELSRDPKELNKLLLKVAKKARSDGEAAIIKQLPKIIDNQVSTMSGLQAVAEEFIRANEDLKGFPKVLKVVYDELAQKSPDKPIKEILAETAKESRKRLGLPEPEPGKEPEKEPVHEKKGKPPRLPSKGKGAGSSKDIPQPSSFDTQIDAMNKALGG